MDGERQRQNKSKRREGQIDIHVRVGDTGERQRDRQQDNMPRGERDKHRGKIGRHRRGTERQVTTTRARERDRQTGNDNKSKRREGQTDR